MEAIAVRPDPLTPPRARWILPEPIEPARLEALAADLHLPSAVCRLLVRRGYDDAGRAKAYLRPSREHLHGPGRMAGMGIAVERIRRAIARLEPVLVHGDYDVDGICATALMVRALTMMGGRPVPFVPHRLRDGYDLGPAGIAAAQRAGARLIVTADCGIVAHQAVSRAQEVGIDVIVTDHHTPAPTLPNALSVINPNRGDCPYPDKGLAGAAVAFKLMLAVANEIGFAVERLYSLVDLVALATIADLAPLTAENRALARWGISVLGGTPNQGLRALLRSTALADREEITAGQISFILAPRLNAIGRLDEPMKGVELLLTDRQDEADALARELEEVNHRRRQLDERTLDEALELLRRDFDPDRDWGVVLASPGWHPGVIGIVASRVAERIHRPTVLIALGEGEGKGSARSIPGFHLHQAFVSCESHLIRYGGHRAAAGCSIDPANVDAFRRAFALAAESVLRPVGAVPEVHVDVVLSLGEADHALCRMLRHFGPFGIGNPAPVFAAKSVAISGRPRVVGSKHLKLTLAEGGARLEAIAFGMAHRLEEVAGSTRLDVAFKLEENRWRHPRWGSAGARTQARIVDFRRA